MLNHGCNEDNSVVSGNTTGDRPLTEEIDFLDQCGERREYLTRRRGGDTISLSPSTSDIATFDRNCSYDIPASIIDSGCRRESGGRIVARSVVWLGIGQSARMYLRAVVGGGWAGARIRRQIGVLFFGRVDHQRNRDRCVVGEIDSFLLKVDIVSASILLSVGRLALLRANALVGSQPNVVGISPVYEENANISYWPSYPRGSACLSTEYRPPLCQSEYMHPVIENISTRRLNYHQAGYVEHIRNLGNLRVVRLNDLSGMIGGSDDQSVYDVALRFRCHKSDELAQRPPISKYHPKSMGRDISRDAPYPWGGVRKYDRLDIADS